MSMCIDDITYDMNKNKTKKITLYEAENLLVKKQKEFLKDKLGDLLTNKFLKWLEEKRIL